MLVYNGSWGLIHFQKICKLVIIPLTEIGHSGHICTIGISDSYISAIQPHTRRWLVSISQCTTDPSPENEDGVHSQSATVDQRSPVVGAGRLEPEGVMWSLLWTVKGCWSERSWEWPCLFRDSELMPYRSPLIQKGTSPSCPPAHCTPAAQIVQNTSLFPSLGLLLDFSPPEDLQIPGGTPPLHQSLCTDWHVWLPCVKWAPVSFCPPPSRVYVFNTQHCWILRSVFVSLFYCLYPHYTGGSRRAPVLFPPVSSSTWNRPGYRASSKSTFDDKWKDGSHVPAWFIGPGVLQSDAEMGSESSFKSIGRMLWSLRVVCEGAGGRQHCGTWTRAAIPDLGLQ